MDNDKVTRGIGVLYNEGFDEEAKAIADLQTQVELLNKALNDAHEARHHEQKLRLEAEQELRGKET